MTIKERFIDANGLHRKITEMTEEPAYQHIWEDWKNGLHMAIEAVSEAPTVDAVRVVRCRDCIWSKKPTDEQKAHFCLVDDALLCKFWKDKKGRWPFDYCSYGTCRTELL